MAKIKYNFAKIRLDYLKSDINSVKEFFKKHYNTYSSHIAIKTSGWTKEKDNYIENQIEKAKAEYEAERNIKWKKVLKNIDIARMAGLQELCGRLIKKDDVNKLQIKEITEALKHMRLELWETTDNVWTTDLDWLIDDLDDEK